MIMLFGKVPVSEYGTPTTDEIYRGMEECLVDYDVILLANHGIVAVGRIALMHFIKWKLRKPWQKL